MQEPSMPEDQPQYLAAYTPEQLNRSKKTLLQVAVALGDFLSDVVLVGGLVPILLIDQEAETLPDQHVGSTDVDLGLRFAIVDQERYDSLAERLIQRGFSPDTNSSGNPTKQRWVFDRNDNAVVIDFLIDEEASELGEWGRVMHLTERLFMNVALGD